MKQVELAQQPGVSKSYLSMILSGKRIPNPELTRKLSSLEVHNFEASSSLRGRCPKPLDECATQKLKTVRVTCSLSSPAVSIISASSNKEQPQKVSLTTHPGTVASQT